MRLIRKGSTDITDYVFITDSAAFTPETGITVTDLDLQYVRNGAAPSAKVDASALSAIDDAHADNSMFEVDATDQPGLYRVDWPDAMFATGVSQVVATVKGAGFHPVHIKYQLVDFDPDDVVRLGLTALPNAAADAAGGMVISDAGGLDMDGLDTKLDAIIVFLDTEIAAILADTNELQADWTDGGRLDLLLDAIKVVTDEQAVLVLNATVDTVTNSHSPTTTQFQCDDITEATPDHYNGRLALFITGALAGQIAAIEDYIAVGGIGQFTVTAMTEPPVDDDTLVIL